MKIEGFYGSMKAANDAVARLKAAGIEHAVVDMNEHYVEDRNIEINNAGTETAPSLAGLVLESDVHAADRSKAPLTAADPMVSGFGHFEEIADVNCKVMAEVDENRAEEVKKVIRETGGSLESPNFRKPRIPDDADINLRNVHKR